MYGKFVNETFVRAPYGITEEEARANGYKPVVLTPPPETDNFHYPKERLEETDSTIIRHWDIVEFPIDPDPDLDDAEALDILLGGDET